MRKLIRSRVTKAFLTEKGLWTTNIVEAQHFNDDIQARAIVQQLGVQDAELYYHFDSHQPTDYDFTIPLR